jgi:hypothetical protein
MLQNVQLGGHGKRNVGQAEVKCPMLQQERSSIQISRYALPILKIADRSFFNIKER